MKKVSNFFRAVIVVFAFLLLAAPLNSEAASKVKLNKKSASIYIGQTYSLKMQGTKKKVKWSTSNKKIATVSSKGKVTGKKAGKATITAKVGSKKYTCKVTVKKCLSVAKTNLTLKQATKVKVNFKKIKTHQVSFKIKDTSIVSCSWANTWTSSYIYLTITPKKSGTTTVTITNKYNNEKVTLKVTVPNPWDDVEVVIPETIGEQDNTENRMKINNYSFYAAEYSSASYYYMNLNFTCVKYGKTGRSNWGEYFYCYDKDGNILKTIHLYAGSLALNKTYNDNCMIPKDTAKIEFMEYPDNPQSTDTTPDDTTGSTTEDTTDPTLWTYTEAKNVYDYAKKANDYASDAADYMDKACDNGVNYYAFYAKYALNEIENTKTYLNKVLAIAEENRTVDTTDGSTLTDKINETIQLCDDALALESTTTYADRMDLYNIIIKAGTSSLGVYKITYDMYTYFLE